ncbi:digestive cysteine proteinase 1-like [Alosa sapidissima]|uniref:digestive cysteine proteinase 1-like n=1 Tax=Alosa sapidissima TaxID=34773 RepID=UPI001C089573|nr:digestive cysteine proteinase 1-like [Alosa sapidissima]
MSLHFILKPRLLSKGWCGSWFILATGSIEGQHFKKTRHLISLSEQNLVDCFTTQTYGCNGGWMGEAMQFVKNKGIHLEANYPYVARVYDEPSFSTKYVNHTVLLVGYGFEKGVLYWIIKNSWGTGWGEIGYMRMVRDGRNICGIAN